MEKTNVANEANAGEGTTENNFADQIEDEIHCNNIFEAAEKGALNQIKSFVDQGTDVNAMDKNGLAPLHIAAEAGRAECVELLIEYGANIECSCSSDNMKSAIHFACGNGHLDVAWVLINKGANVEANDSHSRTPLYYAAKSGSVASVRLLLYKGADMNALNFFELPVISEISSKDILNIFLKNGYNYERITYSCTILHAAAFYNNAVLADFIFENKFNVNINEKDSFSTTAIHLAAENNSCNVMKILLRNGANIKDSNDDGYNALHVAAWFNKYEAVELLLKNNANINELTRNYKSSALILAVRRNNLETTRLLLSYKADVNIKSLDGLTALDHARDENYADIVNILNPHYQEQT